MPRLIAANEKIAIDFEFNRAIGIGRHIANSLPLPDAEISRRHAQIFPKDGGFVISDLNSRNGIFVNGKRYRERELKEGDELIIGTTLLFFDPPKDPPLTELMTKRGSYLWELYPNDRKFEPAEVTSFSRVELDDLVLKWLNRTDTIPLIPHKLRSNFLKFALSLDHTATRGELCHSALRFLQERVSAQRMTVVAANRKKKRMDILAAATADGGTEQIMVDKDILRVVLHSERAVFSRNCLKDFRYRYLSKIKDPYQINSFVAVPIFCGGRYYGFIYLDHPFNGPSYNFKALAQAYITGSLIGKCLYWLRIARKSQKKD